MAGAEVRFRFDGHDVRGFQGEPVAAALMRAGYVALARSPKYHRPRGPACFRSACDGCLARVDGEPNVMTCRVPLREGAVVESQNTLGARRFDLLRAADWFFPNGLNHHELFAGVPGVQDIMQTFARRVAGLGTMPTDVVPTKPATREVKDTLVIGGGPAGMTMANALADRGAKVLLIEEGFEPGGSLLAMPASHARAFATTKRTFDENVAAQRIELACAHVAGGIFGTDVLVVGPEGARVLEARHVVICTGAHDGVVAFEGNDLPGIVSVRAAGRLFGHEAVPAKTKIAIVITDPTCTLGEAWAQELGSRFALEVLRGTPVSARGRGRVRGITVLEAGVSRKVDADLVIIDAPVSPAYELCAHVGAELAPEPQGFVATRTRQRHGDGSLKKGFWAFGEVAGDPLDAEKLRQDATELAGNIMDAT